MDYEQPSTGKQKWSIGGLVSYVARLLVEPILLSVFLFVLFQRIQAISEITEGTLWTRFQMDMQANMITYWGFFLVIFIIWTAYRTWRMAEDRRQHREIMDALICLINMHRGDNMPKLKPQQPLPNKE